MNQQYDDNINQGRNINLAQIRKKATEFNDFRNSYYNDRINGEKLTEKVTQPFFKSLAISKRRLDENGITMEVMLLPEKKKKNTNGHPLESKVQTGEDKSHIFARCTGNLLARYQFFKNGKKIYANTDSEIGEVDLLKVKGDGQFASCPNCGNRALISTYIDGCDYCHSKFAVTDFDTKVSGYSLKENVVKKTKSSYLGTLKKIALVTVLLLVGLIASLIIVAMNVNRQTSGLMLVGSVFLFAIALLPVLFRGVLIFFILFVVLYSIYVVICVIHSDDSDMVKQVLPDFSKADFIQNLEYKLKSIHMADSAKEVSAFADIRFDEIVNRNKNVIDCSLVKVKFKKITQDSEQYHLLLFCKMKLIVMKNEGNRLKRKYENITLKMSLDKTVSPRKIGGITRYVCPRCGGNIDLLNGGICEHCGLIMDYSKYDWIIEDYKSYVMKMSNYGKIQIAIILLYVSVLGVTFLAYAKTRYLDTAFDAVDYSLHRNEVLHKIYSNMPLPEIEGVEPVIRDNKKDFNQKIYIYEMVDGVREAEGYFERLSEDSECIVHDLKEEQNDKGVSGYYVFYKKSRMYGDDIYIKEYVTYDKDSLTIAFSLADKVGE